MNLSDARDIIAILPSGRTLYHYYPDRFAVVLLGYALGDGCRVADLKRSRFARLLQRPAIKKLIARRGDGRLTQDDLAGLWPAECQTYALALDIWGEDDNDRSWKQTTRNGVNLVLQLNFTGLHDAGLDKLVSDAGGAVFNYAGHPVCLADRHTLAWARLDIDLASGTALIEEIQSDWVRNALSALAAGHDETAGSHCVLYNGETVRRADLNDYIATHLSAHVRLWPEAMLNAAVQFLIEEAGIGSIWYHSAESGHRLKKVTWRAPPRSLYSDLPRRFCFEKTPHPPGFITSQLPKKLAASVRAGKERFWHLAI